MASLADLLSYTQNLAKKYTSLDTPKDQSLGETLGDIGIGFVPGLGTAQAGRDFERARRENDYLGMGLSAAGMIPVVGGFVKPIAKTAGKASKIAEALEQITSNVSIRQQEAKKALENLQKRSPHFDEFTGMEDVNDNTTPNAFRAAAALHEIKNAGWEIVHGHNLERIDNDASHYITARKEISNDPEYGKDYIQAKIRISNHPNLSKTGKHDEPDINIAPGQYTVDDIKDMLKSLTD